MSIEDTRQVDDGDLPEGDEQVWDFLEQLGMEARDCASDRFLPPERTQHPVVTKERYAELLALIGHHDGTTHYLCRHLITDDEGGRWQLCLIHTGCIIHSHRVPRPSHL